VTERESDEPELQPFAPQMKALGERIRDIRVLRRMSQEDVADRAGISSHSHVSDIERGRKQPSVETLYRLARALNVHPADLLDDRDEAAVLARLRRDRDNEQ
jgi:transcriptional regulator with XRE-family HTH domain